MLKNIRRKTEGFTIIEVLIVLAIAGLILLIVFLAVPALERNARNTSRKDDVANILGAMNEYVNNNSGQLPTANCLGTCNTADGNWLANAKLSHYTYGEVYFTAETTALTTAPHTGNPAAGGNAWALDTVNMYSYAACSGNAIDQSGNASAQEYVAFYYVETGGTPTLQCQQS